MKSSKITDLEVGKGDGLATVQVEYEILGLVKRGAQETWHFRKREKKMQRGFKLVHTAYGWRIRDSRLVDGEFLSSEAAKARVTTKQDKKTLNAIPQFDR